MDRVILSGSRENGKISGRHCSLESIIVLLDPIKAERTRSQSLVEMPKHLSDILKRSPKWPPKIIANDDSATPQPSHKSDTSEAQISYSLGLALSGSSTPSLVAQGHAAEMPTESSKAYE